MRQTIEQTLQRQKISFNGPLEPVSGFSPGEGYPYIFVRDMTTMLPTVAYFYPDAYLRTPIEAFLAQQYDDTTASADGDNGVLRMGVDAPEETTVYYSYTNMPTTGTMILNGEKKTVTGKSWFDKQGGTYHLLNRKTHWEWFSVRFFDYEEMMLFTFPQSNYQDGTYIAKDGTASRLIDYKVIPLDFVKVNGSK
jgi:hypothetical protein